MEATTYFLHHGRNEKPILSLEPVAEFAGMWRVRWPDIDPSPMANLTRCKQAALEWAEHDFLTGVRKMSGARALKSLNNFWWSSRQTRLNEPGATNLAEAA